MNTSEFRNDEVRFEKEVGKFLDKYFYPKIDTSFKRVESLEEQYQGIDVYIGNCAIDEKVACHYVNSDLPTFAFEISYINRGEYLQDGWLLDDKLKTDVYLLMWVYTEKFPFVKQTWNGNFYITEKTIIYESLTAEEISSIDCCILSKANLLNYLESINLTKDKLRDLSAYMRENKKKIYEISSNLRLQSSSNLVEYPVNLIISKNILKTISNVKKITKRNIRPMVRSKRIKRNS